MLMQRMSYIESFLGVPILNTVYTRIVTDMWILLRIRTSTVCNSSSIPTYRLRSDPITLVMKIVNLRKRAMRRCPCTTHF